ncbi:hypothetical protein VVMO6_01159 [Vibrio vulnificus MO6-24/O]|nr:hypothetical protein VVMO6_01159 [Vibrio vulnificus MO6-24/O]
MFFNSAFHGLHHIFMGKQALLVGDVANKKKNRDLFALSHG